MGRTSFFIDGFNSYHSLKVWNPDPIDPIKRVYKYRKYLWLDLYAYSLQFVRKQDTVGDVFYFSAYAYWRPNAQQRHEKFVRALVNSGVKPIMGAFKEKDRFCNKCHSYYKGHEEKQTDVNIAIHLLKEAFLDSFDTAMLVTNDTDLVPAINMVKALFPKKRIGIVFPIDRWSSELKQVTHFWRKTTKKILKKSQFPEDVTLPDGTVISKPPSWS